MILGLCTAEQYSTERFKNIRRSVQYQYPNGAAPLLALLSLSDDDPTNDPEFSHWEDRYEELSSTTKANGLGITSNGAFAGTSGGDLGATFTWTADTVYRVYVNDTTKFRVGNVVKINATISGVNRDLVGDVTYNEGTDYIKVRAVIGDKSTSGLGSVVAGANIASVPATNADIGDEVIVIGNSAAEGMINETTSRVTVPVNLMNYTQIFRTPFTFSGTSLKTPVKFDDSGPYKSHSKKFALQHMVAMEFAVLFGERKMYMDTGLSGSVPMAPAAGLARRHFGGILWYLKQYEAQYSIYRGGDGSSTGPAAITLDTDDNKRIIENTAGTITEDQFDGWMERLFRVSNNSTNEKLCLCGSGALRVINQLWRSKSTLQASLPLTDTYGMDMSALVTPFGKVYFKTHPLFSNNSTLRNNMLFLDVQNLKYRPLNGRDTELLKNRQPNDADYRMDEWLTEAGVELWYPESHMYIKNVTGYGV